MRKFRNLREIRELNKRQGYHFFDNDTMKFFRSKVLGLLVDGIYFVTSEQFVDSRGNKDKRKYTLRMAMPDGSIETIGGFNVHDRSDQAYDLVNDLPDRLQEALEFFNACWNAGETQKFVDKARVEPENHPDGEYHMDTFCGACSWMMEHPEIIDSSCFTRVVEDYQKAKV